MVFHVQFMKIFLVFESLLYCNHYCCFFTLTSVLLESIVKGFGELWAMFGTRGDMADQKLDRREILVLLETHNRDEAEGVFSLHTIVPANGQSRTNINLFHNLSVSI